MNEEQFKVSVSQAVRDALAEKEDASRLAKVEELLTVAENTVASLSSSVETKEEALTVVAAEKESLCAKVKELEDKLVQADTKITEIEANTKEIEKRALAAEDKLNVVEAANKLIVRMKELADAKVLVSEDKLEDQKLLVSKYSDEEFDFYKADRVQFRNQLEAEFKANVSTDNNTNVTVVVPPADIESARNKQEAASILDVEVINDTIKDKYNQLGTAMANSLKSQIENS